MYKKLKYINICDTKINIFFSCFLPFVELSLKRLLCWRSLRPQGTPHSGGCSLPVFLRQRIAASRLLKTKW